MTVIELLRSATGTDDASPGWRRPEVVAGLGGAATAAVGLLVVMLLVLLGALAVPRASADLGEAVGAGSLLWLLLGGARISFGDGGGGGDGVLALTPLLGLVALLALARLGARRTPMPDDRAAHGAWVAGYAVVGGLAALLGLLTPTSARPPTLLLPLLVVPVVGLLWGRGQPAPLARRWQRLPLAVRRGLRPGLDGSLALTAVGAALLLVALALHGGRVAHVHGALDAGLLGGLLLLVLQLLAAPNLALWALSLAAGPGFSTTAGASTTWSGADGGLLPMIPVLAAQPQAGGLPWVTHLLVLLPVAVGAWLARRTLRRVPRLAATSAKLSATLVAVLVAAGAVGLLDAVGGGSLGGARLSDLGAPAPTLVLVLALEMGLGALVVLGRDWWVLRR